MYCTVYMIYEQRNCFKRLFSTIPPTTSFSSVAMTHCNYYDTSHDKSVAEGIKTFISSSMRLRLPTDLNQDVLAALPGMIRPLAVLPVPGSIVRPQEPERLERGVHHKPHTASISSVTTIRTPYGHLTACRPGRKEKGEEQISILWYTF